MRSILLVLLIFVQEGIGEELIKSPGIYFNPNITAAETMRLTLDFNTPCGVRKGFEYNRIVGGTLAEPGEFPWIVSVQYKVNPRSYRHFCGGTVIHPNWVATAAHCVEKMPINSIIIVAGEYELYKDEGPEQIRGVSQIISNGFERKTFSHDIALIRLNESLILNGKTVAPICVPSSYTNFSGSGIISGWGKLTENGAMPLTLRRVAVPLISQNFCHNLYRRRGYTQFINECQICAGSRKGGEDSCQGDSGGPLMCKDPENRYYLCGIVSWGVGCGRPSFPGVYTQVSCYTDWINRIVNNFQNILNGYDN